MGQSPIKSLTSKLIMTMGMHTEHPSVGSSVHSNQQQLPIGHTGHALNSEHAHRTS